MSVSSTTNTVEFAGDGTDNSPYSFPHPVQSDDDFEIRGRTVATGVEVNSGVALVKGTDYTVTRASDNSTATITLITTTESDACIASGVTMVVKRKPTLDQGTSYSRFSGIPEDTLESDLDNVVLQIQNLQDQIDRCIKVDATEPLANLSNMNIGPLIDNGSKPIIVSSTEDGVGVGTLESGVVIGPASATDNAVARFDATTGELIQNSGVIIDDSNNVSGVVDQTMTGDLIVSSGKAVKVGTEEVVTFTDVASAVNEVDISNAATGNHPAITATGDDTDINLTLDGKGTGTVRTLSSNLDVTGNIVVSGTVDGRDVAADGSALDALTPGSTTDNAVARWDGTGGTAVQDSSVLIDDSDNVSGVGTLGTSGNITSGSDTDRTTTLGRALIDSRSTDQAFFSHVDMSTTSNYGLVQNSSGATTVNAASGQTVAIKVNNSTVASHTGSAHNFQQDATFESDILLGSSGVNKTVSIWVPASDMEPFTSNGAGEGRYENGEAAIKTLDFDQTTQELAGFVVDLGYDYDGSAITLETHWTTTAGSAAETVNFEYEAACLDDGEVLGVAAAKVWDQADTWQANNDLHIIATSGTPDRAGSGHLMQVRVRRAVAQDDLGGDAQLVGCMIRYT